MTANWSRRAFLSASGAAAAALAGCGSSTIESALRPARFLAVGDGFGDLGQGGVRYTVNDASVNIWSDQLATRYGVALKPSASGGLSYARGGARVSGGAPSIQSQIDSLLAGNTLGANDVVLVDGGITDVVAEVTALGISAQTTTNVRAAGAALGAQVRRLVTAGAKYVVVAGVYNLGISPWAVGLGQASGITDLCNRFNEALLVAVVDLGANVLFVDAGLFFNLVKANPTTNSMTNVTDKACTTAEATSCNVSTIAAGIDYTKALFADGVYLTPSANAQFGNYAYDKLRDRW